MTRETPIIARSRQAPPWYRNGPSGLEEQYALLLLDSDGNRMIKMAWDIAQGESGAPPVGVFDEMAAA